MSTQIVAQQVKPRAIDAAMLQHLAGIIKDAYPELSARVDRAVAIVEAGDILPGRGDVYAPAAYVGGRGYVEQSQLEIARAVPHHETSQDAYSITAHYYAGEYPEYFCSCRDSAGPSLGGRAPYVGGVGTCCKHVLAVVLLVHLAPDLEAIQMTPAEQAIAEKCVRAGILTRKREHPLARFLLAQRRAQRAGRPGWHEWMQAARLLAEWRSSDHWRQWVGGAA